jgi:hypothetical protein
MPNAQELGIVAFGIRSAFGIRHSALTRRPSFSAGCA